MIIIMGFHLHPLFSSLPTPTVYPPELRPDQCDWEPPTCTLAPCTFALTLGELPRMTRSTNILLSPALELKEG